MATGAIVEEVALNLEEAADITRRFNPSGVGYLIGGLAVGAAVGFYFGRRWQREKLRAEAYAEAEDDVAKIREYYEAKVVAATPKPTVEEIIADRGYSTAVEQEEQEEQEEHGVDQRERPLPAPVPIIEAPDETPAVIPNRGEKRNTGWDYAAERETRSPDKPYVIHQDELGETGYNHVTFTYYDVDDVLCDEDDTPVTHGDLVVGQDNLKWGHGSDDMDVVFVRNDKIEQDMEICRSYKSYEEEVLGHTHDEPD